MTIMTITLPDSLHDEVSAAVDSGLYLSEESFVADAVRTLMAARPDLRIAVACKMVERGAWSLGRAAEWANFDIEAMKLALHSRKVDRTSPETAAENEAMALAAIRNAGRGHFGLLPLSPRCA